MFEVIFPISVLPTFVFLKSGEEVGRYAGANFIDSFIGYNEAQLDNTITRLLDNSL